ncbi:putative membrane protein [Rubrobacter radiotolerans]|uniref:DUF202 domain-containing protein n=1 Tax=Rubrobacter radiotolerans TaxID=42256 RepID=A0A023X5Z0_RUBRA|nr:DUF202 domain-containing protein [Rubrobacter radiotolerans]AHY47474.1 putative membrane protein [Rubrobacter radiotolerans]MDX5894878.1 DUF202 domain-containing protein [Rubrobacter radiotolerans]SMC06975.1 putative membrane protein [Rubrobacter radiotolerans DSM 5868]
MSEKTKEKHPRNDVETREHLANERTLLAWVRTGVGLISVGFVVERAGALTSASGGESGISSEVFGVGLVGLGSLALIVGAWQFFSSRRMIRTGRFTARATPYMIVVAGSLLLATLFVLYVLFS